MNKRVTCIAALLALAVAGSGAWILLGQRDAADPHVVIEVNGAVYCDYAMSDFSGIIPISTPGGGENRVYVQDDLVYMDSANCPDQTCVKQGAIKDGTMPIVCLPHRVVVRIEGGNKGLDAAN